MPQPSRLQREIRRRQDALPAVRPATFVGGGAALSCGMKRRLADLPGSAQELCQRIFPNLNNYERLQVIEMFERKTKP